MDIYVSVKEFINLIAYELGRPYESGALVTVLGISEEMSPEADYIYGTEKDSGYSGTGKDSGHSGTGKDRGYFGAGKDSGHSGTEKDRGYSGTEKDRGYFGADRAPEKMECGDTPCEGVRSVSKTDAARILYNTMLLFTSERDEKDISAAGILKDLYDCRKCVRYIAQMYVKGIIPPVDFIDAHGKKQSIFGTSEKVTREEAALWTKRLLNKEKRIIPAPVPERKMKRVSFTEAVNMTEAENISEVKSMPKTQNMSKAQNMPKAQNMSIAQNMSNAHNKIEAARQRFILIDMRDENDTEIKGLFKNTVILKKTLQEIRINPYSITADTEQPLILLCDYGVKSVLAGEILEKFEFSNVFVIDNPQEFQYHQNGTVNI